ncbi:hypothetical protein AAG590_02880 [Citromicrobium bathyomarinum]
MKKSCFVISPIGETGSATRKRADQIYKYLIEPVLGKDWLVERADRIAEPGIITNQIIDRLANADLVIADLSERNPNVFYELAVRHILRKPYVHLIAHDEDIPFDNAPVRAIQIDISDLDSVDAAKNELNAQVAHAMTSKNVESPISVSLKLSEIRKSGDEDDVIISSLLSEMNALRRQVSSLSEFVAEDIQISKKNMKIMNSGYYNPSSSAYRRAEYDTSSATGAASLEASSAVSAANYYPSQYKRADDVLRGAESTSLDRLSARKKRGG